MEFNLFLAKYQPKKFFWRFKFKVREYFFENFFVHMNLMVEGCLGTDVPQWEVMVGFRGSAGENSYVLDFSSHSLFIDRYTRHFRKTREIFGIKS